jgi:hypothetical protein
MPKQTAIAEKLEALETKFAELEQRTTRLEVVARAAIALVELFQAFQSSKHQTTETTNG